MTFVTFKSKLHKMILPIGLTDIRNSEMDDLQGSKMYEQYNTLSKVPPPLPL